VSTASDIAALKAAVAALTASVTVLQQRLTRAEADAQDLRSQLQRVKKG
jgi:hypothetical protein